MLSENVNLTFYGEKKNFIYEDAKLFKSHLGLNISHFRGFLGVETPINNCTL
jgi:hypothetical protein